MMSDERKPCPLGVGCDDFGVCYAIANDKPEMCPHHQTEAPDDDALVETMAIEAIRAKQPTKPVGPALSIAQPGASDDDDLADEITQAISDTLASWAAWSILKIINRERAAARREGYAAARGTHQPLLEALFGWLAYDQLLRSYAGPADKLYAGDHALIDKTYDECVRATTDAIRNMGGEDV